MLTLHKNEVVAQFFAIDTLEQLVKGKPQYDAVSQSLGPKAKPYYDVPNRRSYLFFDTLNEQWEFSFYGVQKELGSIRYLNKEKLKSLPEFDVKWFESGIGKLNSNDIYKRYGNPRKMTIAGYGTRFEYQAGDLYYTISSYTGKGLAIVSYDNRNPQYLKYYDFMTFRDSLSKLSKTLIFEAFGQPSKVYLENKKSNWIYAIEDEYGYGNFNFHFDTLQSEQLKYYEAVYSFRKSFQDFDTVLITRLAIGKHTANDVENSFGVPGQIRLSPKGELWQYQGKYNNILLELYFNNQRTLQRYVFSLNKNDEAITIEKPKPKLEK